MPHRAKYCPAEDCSVDDQIEILAPGQTEAQFAIQITQDRYYAIAEYGGEGDQFWMRSHGIFELLTDAALRLVNVVRPPPPGYTTIGTGGGCLAWRKKLPDGSFILITDENGVGIDGDPKALTWIVGRHKEDDFLICRDPMTLETAVTMAEHLPDPTGQQSNDWRP